MAKPKTNDTENPNPGQPTEQSGETPAVPTEPIGASDANDANAPVQPADTAGEVTAAGTTDESTVAGELPPPAADAEGVANPEDEQDPEVNPNTGENDDERLKRGVEGDPVVSEPVEEVVEEPKASYGLNFDTVKGDINTVQKICDGHAVVFNLNLYENTASVAVPEGSTFPSEALAPYL
jgi:hypothetical protein